MASIQFNQVDPQNPRALGVCDNCQATVYYDELRKQMQYRGNGLRWDGTLRCGPSTGRRCLDVPQAQDMSRRLPTPDPTPILNPRPETG